MVKYEKTNQREAREYLLEILEVLKKKEAQHAN